MEYSDFCTELFPTTQTKVLFVKKSLEMQLNTAILVFKTVRFYVISNRMDFFFFQYGRILFGSFFCVMKNNTQLKVKRG